MGILFISKFHSLGGRISDPWGLIVVSGGLVSDPRGLKPDPMDLKDRNPHTVNQKYVVEVVFGEKVYSGRIIHDQAYLEARIKASYSQSNNLCNYN